MNWNMGQTSLPARHQDKQAKTKAFPPDLLLFELPVEVTTPLKMFFSFSFLSNLIKKILHSYFWLASWLITDTTKINSHKQYPRVQVYKLENQSSNCPTKSKICTVSNYGMFVNFFTLSHLLQRDLSISFILLADSIK